MIRTSFAYTGKSAADHLADFCLRPCRLLFKGRSVTAIKCGTLEREFLEIHDRASFPEKTLWKIAVAIVLMIPGMIVGISLKLATLTFSATYNSTLAEYKRQKETKELHSVAKTPDLVYIFTNLSKEDFRCKIPIEQIRDRYTKNVQIHVTYNYRTPYVKDVAVLKEADLYLIQAAHGACYFLTNEGRFEGAARKLFDNPLIKNRRCILVHSEERLRSPKSLIENQPDLQRYPVTMEAWRLKAHWSGRVLQQ